MLHRFLLLIIALLSSTLAMAGVTLLPVAVVPRTLPLLPVPRAAAAAAAAAAVAAAASRNGSRPHIGRVLAVPRLVGRGLAFVVPGQRARRRAAAAAAAAAAPPPKSLVARSYNATAVWVRGLFVPENWLVVRLWRRRPSALKAWVKRRRETLRSLRGKLRLPSLWPFRRGGGGGVGGRGGALTAAQQTLLSDLKVELFGASSKERGGAKSGAADGGHDGEDEKGGGAGKGRGGSSPFGPQLERRGRTCGLPLHDVALLRYLKTAGWKRAYPDGNTVAQSVLNTLEWRERRQVRQLLWQRRTREARVRGPLTEEGLVVVSKAVDRAGRAAICVRPSKIEAITAPSKASLKKVPDLIVYSLERAELLQTKAGTLGAGVIVLIDCAGCSFNDMKRFILAAVPSFRDLATHYPDRLNAIRVVNAPSAANFVYRCFTAPLMSENTNKKVKIVGDRETAATIRRELGGALAAELKSYDSAFDAARYLSQNC